MQNLPYLVKEKLVIEINVIGYKTQGESSIVFIKKDSKIFFSIVVDCFCYHKMNKTVEILRNLNTHIPQVIIKIRNDSFNFLGFYV